VGTDFSSEVFSRVYQTSKVWSRARVMPISGNANGLKYPYADETSRATGSRQGGVRGYWLAEAATKTASQPKFGLMELSLKKAAVLIYATDEVLQDSEILGRFIVQAATEELTFMMDDAAINGDGVGKPLGILNGNCLVSVAKETGQTAKTLIYENILNMVSRCWSAGFERSVWYCNQNVIPQLFAMNLSAGTSSVPVYSPANGSRGSKSTLFGLPIHFIEQCPTLGTAGDIILADMSQYLGIQKGGVQSAVSGHVRFINDESIFRLVIRIDGQPMWSSALTPYKDATTTRTVSPFLALAARA